MEKPISQVATATMDGVTTLVTQAKVEQGVQVFGEAADLAELLLAFRLQQMESTAVLGDQAAVAALPILSTPQPLVGPVKLG